MSEIHNQTIASGGLLTNSTLQQLQTLANVHEWGLAYNESDPVRAIAGAVLGGEILQALNTTLSAPLSKTSAQRLTVQFGAYGTFMAFFGLANLQAVSGDFKGIVDYASSLTFELVTNATVNSTDLSKTATVNPDDVSVRFLFVNGTASDDNVPQAYPLFGQSETMISWADFSAGMSKFAVGDTASWCQACGNSTGICAPASTSSTDPGTSSDDSSESSSSISPGVAGAIGVLSMLGLVLLIAGAAALAGFRVARKRATAVGTTSTVSQGDKA